MNSRTLPWKRRRCNAESETVGTIIEHDKAKGNEFFFRLLESLLPIEKDMQVILVTHFLPDRLMFLDALSRLCSIALIIPKPHSVDVQAEVEIVGKYPVCNYSRIDLSDSQFAVSIVRQAVGSSKFAIIDMGGYFAPTSKSLYAEFGNNLLGIIEDTENGQQKYEKFASHPSTQLVSVARSPLKEPEDFLVGQSMVFSMEKIFRECGQILQGRRATVIGYGKVGRSAARALVAKSIEVSIVELDPLRSIEARAHGHRVLSKKDAFEKSTLILCATGNNPLRPADYGFIPNGSFLGSVTSSDDEIDVPWLESFYRPRMVTRRVDEFSRDTRYFYLMNKGNAVNFIDGAVVGPFIFLVQGEILCILSEFQKGNSKVFHEPRSSMRRLVAKTWLNVFHDDL